MTVMPVPDARTLSWSRARTKTSANWPAVHDQPWSQFVRWLELDKPATTKEVRPYVGGTFHNGRRSIRTVEQRFFLTLDADYADVDFPLDVADILDGVPYVIHTTWRHTFEAHRYRPPFVMSNSCCHCDNSTKYNVDQNSDVQAINYGQLMLATKNATDRLHVQYNGKQRTTE